MYIKIRHCRKNLQKMNNLFRLSLKRSYVLVNNQFIVDGI